MTNLAKKLTAERHHSKSMDSLVRRAVSLSWFTIIYNLIEGFVAIFFGLEKDEIGLASFGGDSLIEVASATIVLWRFYEQNHTNDFTNSFLERERQATFAIGVLFVLLAIITIIAALLQISSGSHPETTLPGLIISALSLSFMFYLWTAKNNVAKKLDSATMMKDADCSLSCILLSLVLFIGSLAHVVFPTLWWSDAVAALLLALLIGREGINTIKATRHRNFTGGCGCVKR